MIWVTSRQARLEALIIGVLLVALTSVYLVTGREMANVFRAVGLNDCVGAHFDTGSCRSDAGAFIERFNHLSSFANWLNFLPVLLGLLLASPAVADLEQGTYRLIWTQSVSRRRWLFAKMGFGVGAATVIFGGLVLLWSWWRGPFDDLQGRFESNAFNFEGTVPIAYAIFAFALCLAIGTMLRRMVPAAGISIVAFLATRLVVENRLRPHYLDPLRETWSATQAEPPARLTGFGTDDWIISEGFVDASGRTVSFNDPILRSCIGRVSDGGGDKVQVQAGSRDVIDACLRDHGFVQQVLYQPAHRFWTFQGIETAIFLALSVVLLALTAWWVSRRIA
jgi:hypothetical protein